MVLKVHKKFVKVAGWIADGRIRRIDVPIVTRPETLEWKSDSLGFSMVGAVLSQ
jgi:hypothetical protein